MLSLQKNIMFQIKQIFIKDCLQFQKDTKKRLDFKEKLLYIHRLLQLLINKFKLNRRKTQKIIYKFKAKTN